MKWAYNHYKYFVSDKYCEYLNSRAWPLVKKAVEKGLKNWDTDGDCLIENSGHPDQVNSVVSRDLIIKYVYRRINERVHIYRPTIVGP